jgi:hypothetical protein
MSMVAFAPPCLFARACDGAAFINQCPDTSSTLGMRVGDYRIPRMRFSELADQSLRTENPPAHA